MAPYKYPLLSACGIEIEYMLVDKNSLNISPISDKILIKLAKKLVNDVCITKKISISNELVLHVLEFKNTKPELPTMELAYEFQNAINTITPILDEFDIKLLPTGAHPWMNPLIETKRWPHDNSDIYKQYDNIFKCSGHGFANLQSMHVNLPFANELEFKFLHNAIRLIMPLLPALSASTPILEKQKTKFLDARLVVYEENQKLIPEIAGQIIPEWIDSISMYREKILTPMYKAIAPYDPKGILQHEWLNSRGAIPKFDVGAVEIRILDSQECVNADLSIALFIHAILKKWSEKKLLKTLEFPTEKLKIYYDKALVHGLNVSIEDKEYLSLLDLPPNIYSIREILQILLSQVASILDIKAYNIISSILENGNLSERILKNFNANNDLIDIYKNLQDCLYNNYLYGI